MTRERAHIIAKAVDNIESFEYFIDMIEETIDKGIEIYGIHPDDLVIIELRKVLNNELKFRKDILEAM